MRNRMIAATAAACILVSGCVQTIPPEALQLSEVSLQKRQIQTKRFGTTDEAALLSASAAVLQDLGFSLDESESELGLIVGSKDRDATEAGQIVGAVVIAVLFGAVTPVDRNQKIRASLVTRPIPGDATAVRVTFQRLVWNTQNQLSKIEALDAPELYTEFFEKLSQSVFLEAQEV